MIGTSIEQAASFLEQGLLVGIPTETVYGLAANAYNEEAVLSVFKTKGRPQFDPLIVHTHDVGVISSFAETKDSILLELLEKYSPGPLTVLLKKKDLIHDLVTSGLDRVAVRIPKHPLTLELLQTLPFPLAAPSANPFGYISPTRASHVQDQLGSKIPYILDGGTCEIGLESTIVGLENGHCVVYRKGGLPILEIMKFAPDLEIREESSSKPESPGLLLSHYAPSKALKVGRIEDLIEQYSKEKIGVLSFEKKYPSFPNLILSTVGNIDEAAQNLFHYLRTLDQNSEIEVILTEYVPENGLGMAINDRLRRAAY